MVLKHPPRRDGVNERVKLGNPIDNLYGLRDSLVDLRKGWVSGVRRTDSRVPHHAGRDIG